MSDDVFTIGDAPYNPDMALMYSALIGSHESHEVIFGVWEHVFMPPNSSFGFDPNIKQIDMDLRSGEPITFKVRYKHTYSFAKIMAQIDRERRLRKIKRRQHRAAQRRKRKGLTWAKH